METGRTAIDGDCVCWWVVRSAYLRVCVNNYIYTGLNREISCGWLDGQLGWLPTNTG